MKNKSLASLNCLRRPARTAVLMLISFILCFAVLGGTLVITGLQSGLSSLESRLGADIMVVPYEAVTKAQLDDMILQGNPGQFYMDRSIADKIASTEGIGQITEQFYLASTSLSCCSSKVQIIGFDPDTDFVIQPWVKVTYKEDLKDGEIFVGHDLNAFPGDELTFFGTTLTVAARLDETGTYYDTAVFANKATIQGLIDDAREKQIYDFDGRNTLSMVSCVLINVADGYAVEDVLNDINIHVKKVEAVQTGSMISDISLKLSGISGLIGMLIAAVWVLVFVVLILAFIMITNERKKEFAVLRALGASRRMLAGLLLKESLFVSFYGSVPGALLAAASAMLFGTSVEKSLSMPFLLPGIAGIAGLGVLSILITAIAASASASVSAYRISRTDAALILRGEN